MTNLLRFNSAEDLYCQPLTSQYWALQFILKGLDSLEKGFESHRTRTGSEPRRATGVEPPQGDSKLTRKPTWNRPENGQRVSPDQVSGQGDELGTEACRAEETLGASESDPPSSQISQIRVSLS